MSTLPAPHGKTLPVFFMQGYLDGLWHAVGKGQLIASYQLAAQELVSDKALRNHWLEPLLAYFDRGSYAPQPLDYHFVSLFQYGFLLNGPQYRKAAQIFTKCAGREWWFGEPPISTYQDTTGLQQHFAPQLWNALQPGKFGAPGVSIHTVTGTRDLGIIGVTTFLDTFRQTSGIACQIGTDANKLDIEIVECPFCLHEHDLCYVLAGIVGGLLEWLHGHWGHESHAKHYLTVNDQVSTNHRVVIDIHQYGLTGKLPQAAS